MSPASSVVAANRNDAGDLAPLEDKEPPVAASVRLRSRRPDAVQVDPAGDPAPRRPGLRGLEAGPAPPGQEGAEEAEPAPSRGRRGRRP